MQPLGGEVVLGADDEAAVVVAEADGFAQPGVVVGGRDDHLGWPRVAAQVVAGVRVALVVVIGCWLLAVGGWWMVGGRWSLVAGRW